MTQFTGTLRLARLALRRDRIQLPVWILGLVILLAISVASVIGLYPNEDDRIALARSSATSPVSLMTNGLVSGTSLGATVAAQALLVMLLAVAVMSTFAVVRHTRQNEELGRSELVGAGIVGRHAGLAAALLVVTAANVVVALLSTLTLIANDLPVGGSLLSGAAIAAVGITFVAIAAVVAQISGTSRGANGIAMAAVGVAFLLRAVGDAYGQVVDDGIRVVSAWPSWLSPMGWGQQARPYDGDQWWVLAVLVVAVAALVATAFALTSHRDVGAGMRAVPPGPAEADARLLSPLGLAWRLQRGVLLAWVVALLVLGATYGGVGTEADDLIGSSEQTADVIEQIGGGGTLTDAVLTAALGLGGVAVAGYAVRALLRMRSEESTGRLEALLATGVSRTRWMASHVTIAVAGTVVLMGLMGLAAGVVFGLVAGDTGTHVAELVPAALARVPAALTVAGFAVAILGLLPRWAVALSWAVPAACLVLGQLGVLLDLPQPLLDLSPFTHTPAAPSVDVTAAPLLVLGAVAAGLVGFGLASFRRRDLALS
ncbi:MAG: ABC transporter permease [Acidimicrobiales bacterium]